VRLKEVRVSGHDSAVQAVDVMKVVDEPVSKRRRYGFGGVPMLNSTVDL
jgi:hypothetical protein